MKKYIGTKIIEAEPAYHVVDEEGKVRIVTEAAEAKRYGTVDLGYKVRYPDGYESFSPKGVFEEAYRPHQRHELRPCHRSSAQGLPCA